VSRRNIPHPKLPLRYDQHVTPPFRLDTSDDTHLDRLETLSVAVDEFVRYAIPPGCATAGVFDSNGTIVIAYTRNGLNGELEWFGVRAAVDVLREHSLVDPLLFYSIERHLEPK
jgi:hypothetical protein